MPYTNFSSHAPTGAAQKYIISPNQYSENGRNIGYPSKYSVYVNKISEADGSALVTETREVSDLIGNRLYLWHRPITKADGTVTQITVGGGGSPIVDAASTNAKSAYIVFSTVPTSSFTVTYIAAPDCINAWNLNTLQDDVMELQRTVGLTNTGAAGTSAGFRNVAYAIFNSPTDSALSGVVPDAVYLSHLSENIVIGSTNDATISGSLGDSHTIQIGRSRDEVLIHTTGLHVVQPASNRPFNVTLGTRTGDTITYKGQFSGAGPVTIGGPEWSNIGGVEWASRGYSGIAFSTALTGSYYSGAMLKVHGDVAVMGGIKAVGQLVVVTETGTTSIVLGDWTVQDQLFVYGDTLLNNVEIGNLYVKGDLVTIDNNIVLSNLYGESTVDGLDPSEIKHSYKTVTKKRINNCVIDGRHTTIDVPPKLTTYSPFYKIANSGLIGEIFALSGNVLAYNGVDNGIHSYIDVDGIALGAVVSGTFTGLISWTGATHVQLPGTGERHTGVWSPGIMDPGKLWVKITDGPLAGYNAPVYGYRILEATPTGVQSLRLFVPDADSYPGGTPLGTHALLYNPGTLPYNFITAAGGASPTFTVEADTNNPLKIAFDDEIRILSNSTPAISMSTALENSINGMITVIPTGIAYIFASARDTDPENPPTFKARPVPFRMPNETVIGEVVASKSAGVWSILDTICYRPNGLYDSGWIPILSGCALGENSGRMIPGLGRSASEPGKVYFQHHLGPELDTTNLNIDLYMGSVPTSSYRMLSGQLSGFNHTHTDLFSFHGQDHYTNFGLSGRYMRVPISSTKVNTTTVATTAEHKAAHMFYIDSRVAGVQLNTGLMVDVPTGLYGPNRLPKRFQYARLVMRRDV